MSNVLTAEQVQRYEQDGIVFPFRVVSPAVADGYAKEFVRVEQALGGRPKSTELSQLHMYFPWAYELVTQPKIIDAVEDLLGPDLIIWGSSWFGKHARDRGFVSWHQDGTYWNLDSDKVCTAWVALTPARRENGCMRVVPGTHRGEIVPHRDTYAQDNLLSRGQEIAVEVDEATAVDVTLEPGEMSLHHVKIVHGSGPNPSDIRRIGAAIRFITPEVAQVGERPHATLVRGEDRFGHYDLLPPPTDTGFDAALAAQQVEARRYLQTIVK